MSTVASYSRELGIFLSFQTQSQLPSSSCILQSGQDAKKLPNLSFVYLLHWWNNRIDDAPKQIKNLHACPSSIWHHCGRCLLIGWNVFGSGHCWSMGIQWKLVASLLKIPMDSNEMRSVRLFHQWRKYNDVTWFWQLEKWIFLITTARSFLISMINKPLTK